MNTQVTQPAPLPPSISPIVISTAVLNALVQCTHITLPRVFIERCDGEDPTAFRAYSTNRYLLALYTSPTFDPNAPSKVFALYDQDVKNLMKGQFKGVESIKLFNENPSQMLQNHLNVEGQKGKNTIKGLVEFNTNFKDLKVDEVIKKAQTAVDNGISGIAQVDADYLLSMAKINSILKPKDNLAHHGPMVSVNGQRTALTVRFPVCPNFIVLMMPLRSDPSSALSVGVDFTRPTGLFTTKYHYNSDVPTSEWFDTRKKAIDSYHAECKKLKVKPSKCTIFAFSYLPQYPILNLDFSKGDADLPEEDDVPNAPAPVTDWYVNMPPEPDSDLWFAIGEKDKALLVASLLRQDATNGKTIMKTTIDAAIYAHEKADWMNFASEQEQVAFDQWLVSSEIQEQINENIGDQ